MAVLFQGTLAPVTTKEGMWWTIRSISWYV